ncbi:uncharacterized membrane protein YheB (UPF0754 family) [Evansella vedderi]|uniref:Uncharacterized membrane protein YheB (UPF0754 family) n=1 Tax=Evansella vedderi TaxID=38282 RepID=A0ABT9ZVQ1_9BACI|nr:DUF445 family protein [Evansella vedderi]MDQ0254200.1 uncharacterized membrane protein YheB (UPF0754 family) [Evansella vedderi]
MEFQFLWIAILIVIGSFVGGGTNIIAIRMLFRPHGVIYVGPYKLPFTPGLIPKRREQIAAQLGKMVEEHLVTPEGIAQKIFHQPFIEELSNRAKGMLHSFLNQELTVDDWLREHVGGQWSTMDAREKLEADLRNKIWSLVKDKENDRIVELLPQEWKEKIEGKIPVVSKKILNKGVEYLESPEGEEQMDRMVTQFFASKGNMGGLLGRMIQRVSPTSIISNELTKLLQDVRTEEMINNLLQKEWNAILEKTPSNFISRTVVGEKINGFVKVVVDETPIIGEWEQPLNKWAIRYEEIIVNSFLPIITESVTQLVQKHLKTAMKHLGIQDIVRKQINSFPLQRLEAMLLSIAGRELKMIALLGAMIGGLIGLLQGIIIFIFI